MTWKPLCKAGMMRHKINFLSPPTGTDDYGAPNKTWGNFATNIWASKEPLIGKEYFEANSTQSEVEVKFRMRYINGVSNSMRIQHGYEIYQILSAINVNTMNRELLCYCKLVV